MVFHRGRQLRTCPWPGQRQAWNPCSIRPDPDRATQPACARRVGAGPRAGVLADWTTGAAGAQAPLLRVSTRGLLKDATGRVPGRGLRREVDGGSSAMATAGGSRRAPVPGPRLGLPLAAHLPASLGGEGAKDSLGGALAGPPFVLSSPVPTSLDLADEAPQSRGDSWSFLSHLPRGPPIPFCS